MWLESECQRWLVVVVVVVEFTLLTSILSGMTWTVACSESLVSSGKVDGRCGEVGCRQEVSSTAAVRRQRNLFSQIVPFDIEGPGVEPGTTTEGCALLECQSRSHHHHHLFLKRPFFHAKLGLDVCTKSSPSTYP